MNVVYHRFLLLWLFSMICGVAAGAEGLPTAAVLAERASHRFPQPVRAGELVGRRLLGPSEDQPVLGRVVTAARNAGRLDLLVHVGGVAGFGGRTVVVPMDAVALLGEHVALMDIAPGQLEGLPAAGAGEMPIDPGEIIRVGLVKPFH